jgi:DNA-binding IscR family transcriptional regulator
VHGGYVLARPASEIALAELLELLGESFQLADCNWAAGEGACSLEAICPMRGAIALVDRRIRDVLQAVRLAELFRDENPQGTQYGLEVGVAERGPAVVESGG